ncbi:MAG: tRNA (N6-threonylcarbamoyladenosine(37)-N6)-methyltransferase TrmO [bacterium]|nr:tRNA (N6-threonylcarbamoyladenosine(37)-N6)-methyltransferase TrmO [bacterium]
MEMHSLPIVYRPIGIVHSEHTRMEDVPRQPKLSSSSKGRVELYPEYMEGLNDLSGFSHIILLVHHHKSLSYSLTIVPSMDDQPRGLFATRAPARPNPIGLSIVKLQFIEGPILHVQGVDMIDETPLLDIKPYIPELSRRHSVRLGWLGEVYKNKIPNG